MASSTGMTADGFIHMGDPFAHEWYAWPVTANDSIVVTDRAWSWRGDTSNAQASAQDACALMDTVRHSPRALDSKPFPTGTGMLWGVGCNVGNKLVSPDWTLSTNNGFTLARIDSGPNTGLWHVQNMTSALHLKWKLAKDVRPDGNAYSVEPKDTAIAGPPPLPDIAVACRNANPSLLGSPPATASLTLTQVNINCKNWINDPQGRSIDSLLTFAAQHETCHGIVAIRRWSGTGGVTPIPDEKSSADSLVRGSESELLTLLRDRVSTANDSIFARTVKLDSNYTPKSFNLFMRDSLNVNWTVAGFQGHGQLC
jgi:hypothetical protein